MNTRFSSLVDVRQRQMDAKENLVRENNSAQKKTLEEIEALYAAIDQMESPQSGDFQEMIRFREIRAFYSGQIVLKREELEHLRQQALILQKELKAAMIEFEKAKHLHDVELQNILKDRKRREEMEMDDISVLLHGSKPNGETE